MVLTSGVKLGPYEILSPLGAGGMGEVYRARDTRLDRTVAIKTLPAHLAHNREFRERFDREARVLAAISHPNICCLFDIGEANGVSFLVMEYLEGETVAKRIVGGPLPLGQLLAVATDAADALGSAHRRGIVHRDLKPANIMLTAKGAKLLDFGLARDISTVVAVSSAPSSDGDTSARSAALTSESAIIGTFHYMSPEQLQGRSADARSDIFAFGAVLYEAATGKVAFGGESPASIIAAVLEKQPIPPRNVRNDVPESLQAVIQRCLEKNPEHRWQCAADVSAELQRISRTPERRREMPKLPAYPPRWKTGVALAIALAAIAGLALSFHFWQEQSSSGASQIENVARITHDPGRSEWPTWSPDGMLLAFTSNRSGNFEVYVRRLSGGQEINVSNHLADNYQPAFSPDGNWLAFVSTRASQSQMIRYGGAWGWEMVAYGGDVWVAPALGGQAHRVAENGNAPVWHPDGRSIAFVSGPELHRSISSIDAQGGVPRVLLPTDVSDWEIKRLQYSPNGAWITFETIDKRIYGLPAKGGTPRFLFEGTSHAWDPSGQAIYFVANDLQGGTRLMLASVEPVTCEIRGKLRTLAVMTAILRDVAISKDGAHIAVSELDDSLNLTRLLLAEGGSEPVGQEEVLSPGLVNDHFPAYSPDGSRIAYASNRLGAEEIWLQDLRTMNRNRLQIPGNSALGANLPNWFPREDKLVVTRFYADRRRALWIVSLDGRQAEELVPPTPGLAGCEVSSDGKTVLYVAKAGSNAQLFAVDVSTRTPHQLTTSVGDKYSATWSPDNDWILFTKNTGGAIQLWRVSAAGGVEEQLTSGSDRIRHAFYSPDSRWIYLQPDHKNIYRMPSTGGRRQPVTRFPDAGLFLEEPTISPNGKYLTYSRDNGASSLWLVRLRAATGNK